MFLKGNFVFILLLLSSSINCVPDENGSYQLNKMLSYLNFPEKILSLFSMENSISPSLFKVLPDLPKVSPECLSAVMKLAMPLFGNSSEVIPKLMTLPIGKYLDSWPKPKRLFDGNMKWLGAHEECKTIKGAHYCLGGMKFKSNPLPGQYGLCLPEQCNATDVYIAVKFVQNNYLKNGIDFTKLIVCDAPYKYDTGNIVTIVLASIILFMCLLGTLIDKHKFAFRLNVQFVRHEENDDEFEEEVVEREHKLVTFFGCFSVSKNARMVLATDVPKGAVESLNGIRFFSMTWVIIGHMYFLQFYLQLDDNLYDAFNLLHKFAFMPMTTAYVSVDSFFLLSGFLVAYLTLRKLDSTNGKLPWWKYYLHRYIRLTPTYAFVILLYNNVFPLLFTGPYSSSMRTGHLDAWRAPCNNYWWTNLLYINNFYPKGLTAGCISWTWYLADDMQFYIISPLIIYGVYWLETRHRYGLTAVIGIIGGLTAVSLLCRGIIGGVNHYPGVISATYLPNNPYSAQGNSNMNNVYTKPHTRFCSYGVGLFLGYIVSRKVEPGTYYKKVFYMLGWITSITTALAVIYGPWKVFKPDGSFLSATENVIYETFHRFAWACAVAWVIYACHNKYGGFIGRFLSWRVWIPLSRLTYSTYLLHFLVVLYFYYENDNQGHYQSNLMVFHVISVVFVSYACAFILAVLVEYPILNLEKVFLK